MAQNTWEPVREQHAWELGPGQSTQEQPARERLNGRELPTQEQPEQLRVPGLHQLHRPPSTRKTQHSLREPPKQVNHQQKTWFHAVTKDARQL